MKKTLRKKIFSALQSRASIHLGQKIFGYAMARYKGLHKNSMRLYTLFTSANMVMCVRAGRSFWIYRIIAPKIRKKGRKWNKKPKILLFFDWKLNFLLNDIQTVPLFSVSLKSADHKNDDFRHQIFILKFNGRKIADILAMDKNIELALPDVHENAREIVLL